ncbi:MAG TPA: hypothetical protein ENJ17_05430 [Gammaproteobacteria bacterium]|nr:hypothetical protein [Gammaproteobacteria bacterium]
MTKAVRGTDTPQVPQVVLAEPWHEEDSISLIDLWKVLSRRRGVIFGILALALLAGLLLALLMPEKYTYTTAIEIGTKPSSGTTGAVPIEPPETVLAKIKESYIPQALHDFAQAQEDDVGYKVEGRIPKGSELIVLEAKAPEEDGPAYLTIMQTVIDKVESDHRRVSAVIRSNIATQLAQAKLALDNLTDPSTLEVEKRTLESKLLKARIELERLKDPLTLALPKKDLQTRKAKAEKSLADLRDKEALLKARYQRLDEVDKLLKQQIADLRAQINDANSRRTKAIANLKSEASAMTMLMIDNELQQNRARLAALEERLFIKQQDAREQLENQIAANQRQYAIQRQAISKIDQELDKLIRDNKRTQKLQAPRVGELEEQLRKLLADHQRKIARQQQAIEQLQIRFNNLQTTRALSPPLQSLEPAGPGKKIILILSLFLGLFLGIFAAFFVEFLAKVRQEDDEQTSQKKITSSNSVS